MRPDYTHTGPSRSLDLTARLRLKSEADLDGLPYRLFRRRTRPPITDDGGPLFPMKGDFFLPARPLDHHHIASDANP